MNRKIIYLVFFISALQMAGQEFTPPVAKKIPNTLLIHNDTLIDNYYWMRDKFSAEVVNYLYAENAYADNIMKESLFLQKVLYEEYKSRKKETFTTRPAKFKGYYYYNRNEKGKDYAIACRKKDSLTAPEQIVLDINKLAEDQPYVSVSGYSISPDQEILYYGIDSKGNRVKTYYLKNIDRDTVYKSETIKEVMSLIWAEDNKTVYYTKPENKTLREYRVYKHVIGTPVETDELLFEEPDKTMQIGISKSSSRKFIFISVSRTESGEYWYMNADGSGKPQLFLKRDPKVLYSLDHAEGDEFYIHTNLNAINYRLVKTKINLPDPENWEAVIPANEKVLLEGYRLTKDFLILNEKENAQDRIRIINKKTKESTTLDPGIELYGISYSFEDYDYNKSDEIEFSFANMITPSQTYKYNLYTGQKNKIEEDTILGNYNPAEYETKRIYATARDGAIVPITLCYKKGLKPDGNNPTCLTSYGSYGAPNSIGFNYSEISLLDRGFVFALAHIRGSNDLGFQWYENGKLFNKKNTFYDFIDCAEYLIAQKYTNSDRLAIEGASAGGLLMGAVTNMRPDLFKCVIAGVPFVDVINTMLDETLPLTTFEFEEWGNPKQKNYYEYMRSYSPYDNVARKSYPNILATAGYNDSQVAYWEPAKWVAKIRDMKTDTNLLLFKTNMDGGHGGGSGRTTQFKELAFRTAFMMRCLGVKENYITVKGKIVDENKTEIPFVNVYIEGTTTGTTANADGEFVLTVKEAKDVTLIFQTLGYISHKEKLDLNTQTSDLVVKLKSENFQLKEVMIKANAKDPAYAIMREAIKRRKDNYEKVESFSADIYMKNTVKLLKIPKKLPFFINKKDIPDSNNLGIVSLSESVAKYYFKNPDRKKEEMIASKVAGTRTGFSWNRVEDVFINFYNPSVNMDFYSERPFISPLATGSLLSYKYKYLGTFYVDNKPVHKIRITPRRKGDPLFHGEIYIAEGDNYQVYSSDFYITKDAQIEFADTVHIKQEMVKVNDSVWVPVQLQVYSHIKVFGFTANDLSTASISNYKLNTPFTKKFFSNEVFRIEESATKKDSAFWVSTRPAILSTAEQKYYLKGDSILKRTEKKEYKDSVNKANSRVRFGPDGITWQNSLNGKSFRTNPVFNMVSYNTVEGTSLRLSGAFYQWNKETQQWKGVTASVRYGVDNVRWSGGVSAFKVFSQKKGQSLIIKAGRFMKQYNSHEPIGEFMNMGYTLFNKSNFMKLYQKDQLEVTYNHELVNGLFCNTNLQYMKREALQNRSFYYWIQNGGKHFTSNNPRNEGVYNDSIAFPAHQALQFQIAFKWIPFAKYETYPTFKRVIGTRWPEFSLMYRKGIATKNATFNYDYAEFGIGKDIEMRAFGVFSFDASAGSFFNNNNMNFTDYKHFSGNQTIFLMNRSSSEVPGFSTREAISEFHALNYYSYSTNNKFVELHASHNFRGFFIGKIPLLRKTKFYEIAGVNALFTPEKNYTEVFIGADKILKVFRFDVGTALQNNGKINPFYRFGLRLGF